jgi:hypothetical protein
MKSKGMSGEEIKDILDLEELPPLDWFCKKKTLNQFSSQQQSTSAEIQTIYYCSNFNSNKKLSAKI